MAEYTIPSVDHSFKETISYEVYRGSFSDPLMRAYHARLQFFLLFFIDRSSYINDSDPVWEVILLFQKRITVLPGAGKGAAAAGSNGTVTTYHVVGYTTLYKFLAYPSDWKMRLSQILILPPYQRSGHGQKLLQLVYAEAEKRGMIEVNIEDPRSAIADTTIQRSCAAMRWVLNQCADLPLSVAHLFAFPIASSAPLAVSFPQSRVPDVARSDGPQPVPQAPFLREGPAVLRRARPPRTVGCGLRKARQGSTAHHHGTG